MNPPIQLSAREVPAVADTAEERFDRLYRDHAHEILRYSRRRMGADAAEDLVADTFALAWQKRQSLPAGRERTWLIATARRLSANQFRRQRFQAARLGRPDADGVAPTDTDRLHDQDALRRGLEALTPRDREVLLLVAWHELSHAEAAEVTGCSVTAFGVRLHRARRRLARILHLDDPEESR